MIIPGKHNCCCGSTTPWLYTGPAVGTTLYRIDSVTGAYTVLSTGVLTSLTGISCDPGTGNIYVAGYPGNIYCLDSDGNVLWTVSKGGGATISDLCVTNDGYVYASFVFTDKVFPTPDVAGQIVKLDAATGTEITSGWPYTQSANPDASFNCVCVDQSGNVYAGCHATGTGYRAISLTSSGSFRWGATVTSDSGADSSLGVDGLAINAGGTTLIAQRRTDGDANPTLDSHYYLDSVTGTVNDSFRPLHGSGTGTDGCDYGPSGIAYSTTSSTDASVWDVFADRGPFFNTGTNLSTSGLVCTRNGGVFVTSYADSVTPGANYNVWDCAGRWKLLLPASVLMYTIESSEGRIGAFGL